MQQEDAAALLQRNTHTHNKHTHTQTNTSTVHVHEGKHGVRCYRCCSGLIRWRSFEVEVEVEPRQQGVRLEGEIEHVLQKIKEKPNYKRIRTHGGPWSPEMKHAKKILKNNNKKSTSTHASWPGPRRAGPRLTENASALRAPAACLLCLNGLRTSSRCEPLAWRATSKATRRWRPSGLELVILKMLE